MTFEEIVDQAVEMMRRRGQVSYRMLQRQFDLDDDSLEDLKEELLSSHPIRDDESRGLVWTGEVNATPEPTSTSTQPAQQGVPQVAQPTKVDSSPPSEPPTPDAERRQLTVMFCDLADSTKLSGQLDPEDLRAVIRAYQATSADVIERYDGYIAQHLGDGLVVYFGWPQAHEDDAQRAVHAGLGIIQTMRGLNSRLEQEKGIRLAVRIGIHTGLVVVGEIGQGASQEHLALGDTPNIASRIEGMAEPGTVMISSDTHRLVQGYFIAEELGPQSLKGVAAPLQVYRILGKTAAQSRLDVAAATRGLTPLVGRESEVTLLFERLQQIKEGQGQVVLLSGEAGIGKSRLIQVLRDHVTGDAVTLLECRSSPHYQNTALYPITDLLQRTMQWQQDESPDERLMKLEQMLRQYRLPFEESIPLFATLLSLPPPEDRYPPLPWTPQRQRPKTLEAIVSMLLELAERQPVLFILEDLHWADPSTLELLDLLIDQGPALSIMTLLTYRPTFLPPWESRSHLTPLTLNRLSPAQIEAMVKSVAGEKALPPEVLEQIVTKTDGVPLFVEELTKMVLESGLLREIAGQYVLTAPLPALAIPTSLQDSLMARLDRLATVKAVAQLAATIGREFSYDLLQAVSPLDEPTLQHGLRHLVEAELLYQRGVLPQATYLFKHALIQDAAYQSLLRSTRQQHHQRIVQTLIERFPATVETQPEILAQHCTAAGLSEQAIVYWQRAGERANRHSAYVEAVAHLRRGLEVLQTVPETAAWAQQELSLQLALAESLIVTKGYTDTEVEQVYARAHALCRQVEETPQLFPVLGGLRRFYALRGELQTARELAAQLLSVAQRQPDPALLQESHWAMGHTLHYLGEVTAASPHFAQSQRAYVPQPLNSQASRDLAGTQIACLIFASWNLWALGFPDQALENIRHELALADELSHPFTVGFSQYGAAWLHALRGEVREAREQAEAVLAGASEQDFAFLVAWGSMLRGWALAVQGQAEEGLALMRQCLAAQHDIFVEPDRPIYLSLLAEAYGAGGQTEAGLHVLTEAFVLVDRKALRFYEAELYRIKGVLLLGLSTANHTETATCFQRALSIARRQQAKSWELRAATSLARLWQSQGKRQDAYDLLAPVYEWFTEGFDTADLQEGKALLDELGR